MKKNILNNVHGKLTTIKGLQLLVAKRIYTEVQNVRVSVYLVHNIIIS